MVHTRPFSQMAPALSLSTGKADEFSLKDTVDLVGFVCLSAFVLSVTVLGVEARILG